jgi:hypothetical protein
LTWSVVGTQWSCLPSKKGEELRERTRARRCWHDVLPCIMQSFESLHTHTYTHTHTLSLCCLFLSHVLCQAASCVAGSRKEHPRLADKCANAAIRGAALCWVVTSVGDESARLADRRSNGSGAGDNRWQRFSKSIVVARQRALSLGACWRGKVEAALATVATKDGGTITHAYALSQPDQLVQLALYSKKASAGELKTQQPAASNLQRPG